MTNALLVNWWCLQYPWSLPYFPSPFTLIPPPEIWCLIYPLPIHLWHIFFLPNPQTDRNVSSPRVIQSAVRPFNTRTQFCISVIGCCNITAPACQNAEMQCGRSRPYGSKYVSNLSNRECLSYEIYDITMDLFNSGEFWSIEERVWVQDHLLETVFACLSRHSVYKQ